jgi:hypothetical protein
MKKTMLVGFAVISALLASGGFIAAVKGDGAISLTITATDNIMRELDHDARFQVTVTNTATATHHVTLWVVGLPTGWTSNWGTSIDFDLAPGETRTVILAIKGSVGTMPGTYSFEVVATYPTGGSTLILGPLGSLAGRIPEYVSVTVTDEVYVLLELVIPEYLFGPITGLLACFAAVGVFITSKRYRALTKI